MRSMNKPHFIEPSTGIVHLKSFACGDEYTLCGLAFDEHASERGEKSMLDSDEPCNCPDCIRDLEELLPYLQKEMKRLKREGKINSEK